ncbi:MAG: substrate-binding domain-containing protein [Rectinemataceae bacterium]
MKSMRCKFAFICALFLLVACGKGSSHARGSEKVFSLACIVFQEDQFMRLLQFGMREAAEKAGAILYLGNSDNKVEKEIALVETYTQMGVDAIIIAPLGRDVSVPHLRKASMKGIRIVTAGMAINAEFPVCNVENDPAELGRRTGIAAREYIQKRMNGRARIATIAFRSQLREMSDSRLFGFKAEVSRLPGVEFIAEENAWLPEKAQETAQALIHSHPELDFIWCANEGATIGSVMAVRGSARAGKIVVFGTDASEQIANFLLVPDGILLAVSGQQPYLIGRETVEMALASCSGEQVPRNVTVDSFMLERGSASAVSDFLSRLKAILE